MISERTAIRTPSHDLKIRVLDPRAPAAVAGSIVCPGIRSKGSRSLRWILSMTIALWHAFVKWGNPSFFQFERTVPEHRRLGPGLSRVSD
jgi:hypothetical protein